MSQTEMNEAEMSEATRNMASRWKRLGATLIETVIYMVIVGPIMLATGLGQFETPQTFWQDVGSYLVFLPVFLVLNGYLLFQRGQTIGKVVVKTRIVDQSGNIPSFRRLLGLRYIVIGIVSLIPIIGFFAALVNGVWIFGKERRCLHDYIAGTWVVNA